MPSAPSKPPQVGPEQRPQNTPPTPSVGSPKNPKSPQRPPVAPTLALLDYWGSLRGRAGKGKGTTRERGGRLTGLAIQQDSED